MPDKTANYPDAIPVDVGILAHNEATILPDMLADLARQIVFGDPGVDLRVCILANGCSDDTADAARRTIAELAPEIAARFEVREFAEPGKSRTMNAFLGNILRQEAEFVVFMDGDIRLPEAATLARMIAEMRARPQLEAFTSRPVKDVVYNRTPLGPMARLIAAGREGLTDYRKSIAGSFFILRAPMARRLSLPAGLPVEDGFIRAMVLTDFLTKPEDLTRIDGDPDVFHLYESVRTAGALIRHQTRLVVGSSVNAALFGRIRRLAPSAQAAEVLLQKAALEPGWLSSVLAEELPTAPFGYVPFHFLTKRVRRAGRETFFRPRRLAMLTAGFGLDVLCYALASMRMARGRAAGHW